jgi:hypothetical protein
MLTIAEQIGDDRPGAKVYEFSNTRRERRRPLSNVDVIERVVTFLHTEGVRHLPPALRGEAGGIVAMLAQDQLRLAMGESPWPAGAARPCPGRGAYVGDLVRVLAGDERADADGGLFEDGA